MTDRMSDVAATDESRELAHRTDGETLFEITDLVKHFPLTSGLLIRKQVGAVRAVDGDPGHRSACLLDSDVRRRIWEDLREAKLPEEARADVMAGEGAA